MLVTILLIAVVFLVLGSSPSEPSPRKQPITKNPKNDN